MKLLFCINVSITSKWSIGPFSYIHLNSNRSNLAWLWMVVNKMQYRSCYKRNQEREYLWVIKNTVCYIHLNLRNIRSLVRRLCMIWGWIRSVSSWHQRNRSRIWLWIRCRSCVQIRLWHSTAVIFSRTWFIIKKCGSPWWKFWIRSTSWRTTGAWARNMKSTQRSGIFCIVWTKSMTILSVWMPFIIAWRIKRSIHRGLSDCAIMWRSFITATDSGNWGKIFPGWKSILPGWEVSRSALIWMTGLRQTRSDFCPSTVSRLRRPVCWEAFTIILLRRTRSMRVRSGRRIISSSR